MRQPRTRAEASTDPRVERIYHDSDGWWIDLKDGWRNGFDEPRGALHGIHEDRLRDALSKMSGVVACTCGECLDRLRSGSRHEPV